MSLMHLISLSRAICICCTLHPFDKKSILMFDLISQSLVILTICMLTIYNPILFTNSNMSMI